MRSPIFFATLAVLLTLAVAPDLHGVVVVEQEVEDVFLGAPYVLRGQVTGLRPWKDSDSWIYTDVILTVTEVLRGSAPAEITIKHYGGRIGDEEQRWEFLPDWALGEDVLVCLKRTEYGYYKLLGLQRGKYVIHNRKISGSEVIWEELRRQINELLDGTRTSLPADLPRPSIKGAEDTPRRSRKATHVGAHLDSTFITFDETWDSSGSAEIQFYYNPLYQDAVNTTADSVYTRVLGAFSKWTMSGSYMSFQWAGTTDERQVDNSTSVLLWKDMASGYLAAEYPYNVGTTKLGTDIVWSCAVKCV